MRRAEDEHTKTKVSGKWNAYELKGAASSAEPASHHLIAAVEEGSIAKEMGVEAGDVLLLINGEAVEDVFDYRYRMQEEVLELLIRKADGEEWLLDIEKDAEEDLGLIFREGLMSKYRHCVNRCVFCFIDQNPKGMRETIYFKDDDARLSFLQGNYITLTNMSDHDIERILQFHLSPINISFHTTNPALRVQMLGNPHAGEEALNKAKRLADPANGISLNGQIVLCKDLNDKKELHRTLHDLYNEYRPSLQSVSVVPVGLSKHREGLYPLRPFTRADARAVLAEIRAWQEKSYAEYGDHFVHASDEWYLLAGEALPKAQVYDDFIQYENGVGILRLLHDEFSEALSETLAAHGEDALKRIRREVSVVCGMLGAECKRELLDEAMRVCPALTVHLYPVRNDFYGERITVTGLLTGQDIVAQLKGKALGETLLLPDVMLRAGEEVLLDDMTVAEIGEALGVATRIVGRSGREFLDALLWA